MADLNDDLIVRIASEKFKKKRFCPIKISSLKDNFLYPGVGFQVFKTDELVPVGKIFIKSEFKPHSKDDEKD